MEFELFERLYNNCKIVKMLLKHDAIIFGSYVRNMIFNNNNSLIVNVIISNLYKNIIDRNLYNYIESKVETGGSVIDYKIKEYVNKKKTKICYLRIYYVSDLLYLNKDGTIKDTNNFLLLDINTIGFNRNGIQLISKSNDNIPNPFYDLLDKIKKKEFSLIREIKNVSDLDLVYSYIDNGWKLQSSNTMKKSSGINYLDDQCNICRENIKSYDCVYELSCSHFYHKDCWREFVYQYVKDFFKQSTSIIFQNNKKVKCPHCRTEHLLTNIL